MSHIQIQKEQNEENEVKGARFEYLEIQVFEIKLKMFVLESNSNERCNT